MTLSEPTSGPRQYSGTAIVSFAIALIALLLVSLIPFMGFIAAVTAIATAFVARRELKAEPIKRGFSLSLIAFILGAGIIAFTFVPELISFVVLAISFG